MEIKEQARLTEQQILKTVQNGIISWYEFEKGKDILYYGDAQDSLVQYFQSKRDLRPTIIASFEDLPETGSFPYVFVSSAIELLHHPERLLQKLYSLLSFDGTLFLAMNNRLGIRYFVGDKDVYTKRVLDSLENYRHFYCQPNIPFRGRMYDNQTIHSFLYKAGFQNFHFYSVFSGLSNPQMLIEEGYLPQENLGIRISPRYHNPDTVFLQEENLYHALQKNGMLTSMANAFLFECKKNIELPLSDVQQVTNSLNRNPDNAFSTVLHLDRVEKLAAYADGEARYRELMQHALYLKKFGIKTVPAELHDHRYVMPYIDAPTGQVKLRQFLLEDPDKFLEQMDHFRDLILSSSRHIREDQEDGEGVILEQGFVDMVPLNSFYLHDEFVFYDQEFVIPHYPVNAIVMRMLKSFYAGNYDLNGYIPIEAMMERYGLMPKRERWERMEWDFLGPLLNQQALARSLKRHRADCTGIIENRERMNYPATMESHFREINPQDIGYRTVILFGSGKFAKSFLERYAEEYPVCAIVDNDPARWGQELNGIKIQSPAILKDAYRPAEQKIVIAVKQFMDIAEQLEDMGISSYAVFNAHQLYPRNRKPGQYQYDNSSHKKQENVPEKKKYHIGYIAGVFDLFHVGHLNLLQKAKELCDYLIVGVVQDEEVKDYKGRYPFIPFEERLRIVASNRFVDEARPIPLDHCDTEDAWRMYRFDVQFSGSDYEHDARWLEKQAFLRAHGADLIFFPYTKSTSSTKIKALIDKRLHEE